MPKRDLIRKIAVTIFLTACISICISGCKTLIWEKDHFPEPTSDFKQHIADVKAHLVANQMFQRSDSDASFNLPFELRASKAVSYRGKYLLIHGLNDSPFVWRDMAAALAQRGFDVRAILLPGHGSTPKAQLSMSYRRWLASVETHIKHFYEPEKPFYLGGFSMGGVIATHLAGKNNFVDGLLLFSPAYKSTRDDLLRWAGIYSYFKPWVFGGMIIEDNPVKYNSIPINAASQYYKTARVLERHWPKKPLDIPTLLVASSDDSVVDVDYTISSFDKGFTGEKKLIIYNNLETSSEQPNTEYRSSAYPELRVLNQSHQSVLIAPDNPLYGQHGEVLVCNGNEWPIFSTCLRYTGEHWLGAQHTPSPDEVPVARTTYNPDFEGVLEAFDELFLR